MPEAVIVAAARTPIGRAFKGSLTTVRPDDLATGVIRAALDQVPALDATTIDDLYLGCAEPWAAHGSNTARGVSVLLGLDGRPGAAINRICAPSEPTARMAMHPLRCGAAAAFTIAGV